jgi:hypothetical protein
VGIDRAFGAERFYNATGGGMMAVNYYAPFGDGTYWRNITDTDDTTYGQIAIIGGKRKLVVGDKVGELCLVGGKRRYWVEVEDVPPIGPNCVNTLFPWKVTFGGETYYWVGGGQYEARWGSSSERVKYVYDDVCYLGCPLTNKTVHKSILLSFATCTGGYYATSFRFIYSYDYSMSSGKFTNIASDRLDDSFNWNGLIWVNTHNAGEHIEGVNSYPYENAYTHCPGGSQIDATRISSAIPPISGIPTVPAITKTLTGTQVTIENEFSGEQCVHDYANKLSYHQIIYSFADGSTETIRVPSF